MCFALAGKCGGLGASGFSNCVAAWASPTHQRRQPEHSHPQPDCTSISRRVQKAPSRLPGDQFSNRSFMAKFRTFQSINTNSLETSKAWANCSQGFSRGGAGPLKSFVECHNCVTLAAEPASCFVRMTGAHAKPSLFWFCTQSTTKSIFSPGLTCSVSIDVSRLPIVLTDHVLRNPDGWK